MSRIIWKLEEEFSRLAAQLHLDNPEMNLLQASKMEDLKPLKLHHARAAMDKVIPKARHRPITTIWKLKDDLLKAYALLRERGLPDGLKPTRKAPAPGAKLTDAEWLKVAAEVKRAFPEVGPGTITLRMLNQAIQVLPPARQLKFANITVARRPFDAAMKALAAGAPVNELPAPPVGANGKLPKVFWKPFEYDLMVRYLYKINPLYLESTTLAGLTPTEVKDAAAHTLEPHRRRPGLTTVSADRPRFLEAFARLKAALAAEEEEKRKANEERALEAARQAEEMMKKQAEQAALKKAEEVLSEARQEVQTVVEVTLDAPTDNNSLDVQVKRAMSLLGEVCADAFMSAFVGKLESAFRTALPGVLAAAMVTAAPAAQSAPMQPALSAPSRKHNPEPLPAGIQRPMKICVAGLLKPAHVTEVKEKFDNVFDLRFYHPDQSTSELTAKSRHVDKTILLTDQISHKHQNALDAARIPYTPLPGSIGRLMEHLSTLRASTTQAA